MAEIAAVAVAEGFTLQDRLDAIVATYGRHVMAEKSLRMSPVDGAASVARLRATPPEEVAGRPVTAVQWFEEAGLLRLQLGDDLRVQVRPSGTEPKVKLYGEGIGTDPAPLLDALADLLT
jgi:phosphomannomutase